METYIDSTLMLGLSEKERSHGLVGSAGECWSFKRDYALIIMLASVNYVAV